MEKETEPKQTVKGARAADTSVRITEYNYGTVSVTFIFIERQTRLCQLCVYD